MARKLILALALGIALLGATNYAHAFYSIEEDEPAPTPSPAWCYWKGVNFCK